MILISLNFVHEGLIENKSVLILLMTLCQSYNYRKISNISRTKSQNLNGSRLGLQLFLRNILQPIVRWRMKM